MTAMRIGRAIQGAKSDSKIDFDKDISDTEEFDFFATQVRGAGVKKNLSDKPHFEDLPENVKDEICKQTQFMTLEEEAYFAYQLLIKIEFEPFTEAPKELLDAFVYWPVIVPAREYKGRPSEGPSGPQL